MHFFDKVHTRLLLRDGEAVGISFLLPLLACCLQIVSRSPRPSCDAQLVELHCLLLLRGLEDLQQQEATPSLHTIVACSTLRLGLDPAADVSQN